MQKNLKLWAVRGWWAQDREGCVGHSRGQGAWAGPESGRNKKQVS